MGSFRVFTLSRFVFIRRDFDNMSNLQSLVELIREDHKSVELQVNNITSQFVARALRYRRMYYMCFHNLLTETASLASLEFRGRVRVG